jgi:hypothetical protein
VLEPEVGPAAGLGPQRDVHPADVAAVLPRHPDVVRTLALEDLAAGTALQLVPSLASVGR